MDLECKIEAYPPLAIKLYYDKNNFSEPLTTNQHYMISHFAHDDQYMETILRVDTIEKKQFRKYICKAINRIGESSSTVVLFDTVIPICPTACHVVNYSSDGEAGEGGMWSHSHHHGLHHEEHHIRKGTYQLDTKSYKRIYNIGLLP